MIRMSEDQSAALGAQPLRLVYITGVGRSGSTVLDTVLGNHPEIASVGELCNLAERGWVRGEYCACGVPVRECSWWSDVRRRWASRVGCDDAEGYARLVRQFEEGHLSTAQVPLRSLAQHGDFRRYCQWTLALFEAIREVSGKAVIVESSKRAARAWALTQIPQIDLRVIHLVRDCRGVAWSLQKKFAEDPKRGLASLNQTHRAWRAACVWMSGNLQAAWIRRQLPAGHSLRLRYEDYVEHSDEALGALEQLTGLDMSGLREAVAAGAEMQIGHTAAGNRVRMNGPVRMRLDRDWMERLSASDQDTCWRLAGWLLRRYGYARAA